MKESIRRAQSGMVLLRFAFALFRLMALAAAVALSVGAPSHADRRPRIKQLPELSGGATDWLNSPPLTRADLHGRPVLVVFFEYSCLNCIHTLPYIEEWNRRYSHDGLLVLGIHTPEFQYAGDRAEVSRSVKRLGITFPVLIDSEFRNWNSFRAAAWPRFLLFDGRGKAVFDHVGEGSYEETEAAIQRVLRSGRKGIALPKLMSPLREADRSGAVMYAATPRVYLGERGVRGQHGNLSPFEIGRTSSFVDVRPDRRREGRVYASGVWTIGVEALRHGRMAPAPGDYVAVRYQAAEVSAVIRSAAGKRATVIVTVDGKPINRLEAGPDVRYDEHGHSYAEVDEPRLYQFVRNAAFGTHELRLYVSAPDVDIYCLSFGSAEMR